MDIGSGPRSKDSVLIGEGSYGCVVRPPHHCKKSKIHHKKNEKTVGKIILKKDAEIELQIGTLIKGITGWENYFIVQEEDHCDHANFKEIRKQYTEECKILQSEHIRNTQLTQVVSIYGGKTLFDTLPTSSFNYMKTLRHMLEAIDKLLKQGICHFDLKENNVVVDANSNFRIIDFGGSFVGDKVTEESVWDHIYTFMPEYNTQPPELSVQNGINDTTYSRNSLYHDTVYKKFIFTQMETLLGISKKQSLADLEKFWRETPVTASWDEFFRKYWRTWDSWAIGVIFLKLLKRCLIYTSFIENTWKPHGPVLKGVLRGLLEVDPRKRLLAEDALRLLPS